MLDPAHHPHLSVVIPVYKARDCLAELYRRLVLTLEPITPDFELVLVEDGGGDGSWEEIVTLAGRDPRVKGIKLSRNFGQHYAITAGLDHASGDWVVVMDCDLQDQPEEIGKLYRKAQEGYDLVFARRQERNDSIYRKLSSEPVQSALQLPRRHQGGQLDRQLLHLFPPGHRLCAPIP